MKEIGVYSAIMCTMENMPHDKYAAYSIISYNNGNKDLLGFINNQLENQLPLGDGMNSVRVVLLASLQLTLPLYVYNYLTLVFLTL